MDLTKAKNIIKNNHYFNMIAESLLDMAVVVRAKITGSYTEHKEDLIVKRILESKYNKSVKEVKYIDIGANNFRRGNNSYLFYRESTGGDCPKTRMSLH